MNLNLKFFEVVVATNRNYAYIQSTKFFLSNFDANEVYLLQSWFREYIRCSQWSRNNVQILANSSNIWLSAESTDKDIFSYPEDLELRLNQLTQIEADFFAKIAEIKQPKF